MASSPTESLLSLVWPSAMALQAIVTAADLGLADYLARGPRSADGLATATATHPESLRRLLRALASLGVFAEESDGTFRQTPLSDTLRRDHPQSLRPTALMMGADFLWRPVGALSGAIRSGQPAFDHIFGAPFFEHLAAHRDDAAIFNAAMSSSPDLLAGIAHTCDFSRFSSLVDVGGGHGNLLAAILDATPHLRGILYDLPAVVAGAHPHDRIEVIGGDFFRHVPPGADAYILKGILHDWDDDAAGRILKNIRRAIAPAGTLLLVESVLSSETNPSTAMMDLLMLVLTSGRERTESEFRSLLHAAGFALQRLIPTPAASLLEARPI